MNGAAGERRGRIGPVANDAKPELTTEEPERAVIERVAQALEDQETGEAATIVLDTDKSSTPLLPRRGR
jgi:hypothetical protein